MFDLFQLKIIQEAISIVVFTVVVQLFFKGEPFHWKYAVAFVLVLIAVYLVFSVKQG